MLGLVGHSKDFAFRSNGMGDYWSVLSKRMTQLGIFEQNQFGCRS